MKMFLIFALCLALIGCASLGDNALNFRFISNGQSVADGVTFSQVLKGNSLKPLAPVNLRGTRNTAGDLLIQWDRRARIGAGLRPYVGTPLAEEKELYEVEIYSGSTVVDTFRVSPNEQPNHIEQPRWIITKDLKRAVSINVDGTVRINSLPTSVGDILMVSEQQVYADETSFISFNVNSEVATALPKGVGLLSEASLDDDLSGTMPTYGWARKSFDNNIITIEEFNGVSYSTRIISELASTQLTLRLSNGVVTYYQDRVDDFSPSWTSRETATGAYRLFIREETSNSKIREVRNVIIRHRDSPGMTYTGEQQSTRFGSVQSSIKVIVYQVSALVGRGVPAEKLL